MRGPRGDREGSSAEPATARRQSENPYRAERRDTSDLYFGIEALVSYCSKGMTLFPGDFIVTGVERQTRRARDRIAATIEVAGMTLEDVMRTSNILIDWRCYAGFNARYGAFVTRPSATRDGTRRLSRPRRERPGRGDRTPPGPRRHGARSRIRLVGRAITLRQLDQEMPMPFARLGRLRHPSSRSRRPPPRRRRTCTSRRSRPTPSRTSTE